MDNETILLGVVGSTAYGLATDTSDIDRLGIFVKPTATILGLHPGDDTWVRQGGDEDDIALHEVGKFIRLALAANPTVLELLFLEDYETLTEEGHLLVGNRYSFLSKRVAKTYGGYALQQIQRLRRREQETGVATFKSKLAKRTAKHQRHCARLLAQGERLLSTGELVVKLDDPEAIRAVGELSIDDAEAWFEDAFAKFNAVAANSYLPDAPDEATAEQILLEIRKRHGWTYEA